MITIRLPRHIETKKPCPDPRKGEAKRHQEPQAPTRAENGDVCIGPRKTAGNAGHEITREKAFREINNSATNARRSNQDPALTKALHVQDVSHATAKK